MSDITTAVAAGLIDRIEKIAFEIKENVQYYSKAKIKQYLEKSLLKNLEIKTILHGSNPKQFYDVYCNLRIEIGTKVYGTYDVSKIFSKRKLFVVTASAGSGKSMFIRNLFNESIRLNYAIPFIVELRYLNDIEIGFEEYVLNSIKQNITESDNIIKKLFESGLIILFLDGYDEVKKDNKQKLVHGIRQICDKYKNIKIVITTRPYTNIEMLPNFININIKSLNQKEVEHFVDKQLCGNELSKKIIASIKDDKTKKLNSFITNPLLLTLYILTYQNSSEIPSKLSIFYRRVIDALFIEHDSKNKMGYQHERASNISYDKFEDIMRKFSVVTFFDDKFSFDNDYAHATIHKLITNTEECSYTPDQLINDLELAFSLWINDCGLISFAHRSIQEYFAALYIKDLNDQGKEVMYKKILERADKNNNSDMFNIIRILEEIDNDNYLKYYFIPVMSEFYKKLLTDDTNYSFIQLFFSYFILIEENCHLSVLPSAGKILNLIEPTSKTIEMYIHLRSMIIKLKPIETFFTEHKKDNKIAKNIFLLRNALPNTIGIINDNTLLTSVKIRIIKIMEESIVQAEKQLKQSKEKTLEILGMI